MVGFFRPQIYLTFGLSPQQREHILCHEEEHIRHGDPFWKLAAGAAGAAGRAAVLLRSSPAMAWTKPP